MKEGENRGNNVFQTIDKQQLKTERERVSSSLPLFATFKAL
jgi:hypothetical protein